jgi:hypothetical protein
VFVCHHPVSCVTDVSELSILHCPFCFSNVYFSF